MAWFVYMLRCGDGSLYTGCTNDLSRRLEAHRSGWLALEAGANVIVSGSAVFGGSISDNVKRFLEKMT